MDAERVRVPYRPFRIDANHLRQSCQATSRNFTLSAWAPGMLDGWLPTMQARICTKVAPSSARRQLIDYADAVAPDRSVLVLVGSNPLKWVSACIVHCSARVAVQASRVTEHDEPRFDTTCSKDGIHKQGEVGRSERDADLACRGADANGVAIQLCCRGFWLTSSSQD